MDLTKYIAAHGSWKTRIRSAIETGKSEWTVAGVQVDNQCEFGKFLHGLPPATRSTDIVKEVVAKHAAFHAEAARVLGLALQGKKQEASQAIDLGSTYLRLSSELTKLMKRWESSMAA